MEGPVSYTNMAFKNKYASGLKQLSLNVGMYTEKESDHPHG